MLSSTSLSKSLLINKLMNYNMMNNILLLSILEDSMENVRPRQYQDGLYHDPITKRSIINKLEVEMMEHDTKVVHDMLFDHLHIFGKFVQGKIHSIILKFALDE